MKRKEFIRKTGLGITAGMLVPHISCMEDKKSNNILEVMERKNWAGNYTYIAENVVEPTSVGEVQQLVKKLEKQKALGSMHCFNQ